MEGVCYSGGGLNNLNIKYDSNSIFDSKLQKYPNTTKATNTNLLISILVIFRSI